VQLVARRGTAEGSIRRRQIKSSQYLRRSTDHISTIMDSILPGCLLGFVCGLLMNILLFFADLI
jgi:hypothetical protein